MIKSSSKTSSIKELQSLRNIGPAMARRLYAIGIKSSEQFRKLNPESVYEKLKAKEGGKLDKCALYQLQGALLDVAWWDAKIVRKNK